MENVGSQILSLETILNDSPFKLFLPVTELDDYIKDGGPEVVWHLCGFYQHPLQS